MEIVKNSQNFLGFKGLGLVNILMGGYILYRSYKKLRKMHNKCNKKEQQKKQEEEDKKNR